MTKGFLMRRTSASEEEAGKVTEDANHHRHTPARLHPMANPRATVKQDFLNLQQVMPRKVVTHRRR